MSIHKKALFYGYHRHFEPPVHKSSHFYGQGQKRDTPNGVSLVSIW